MLIRILAAAAFVALAAASPVLAQPATAADRCLTGPRDQAEACLDREVRREIAHMERRYGQAMAAYQGEGVGLWARDFYSDSLRKTYTAAARFRDADCAYRALISQGPPDTRRCVLEHVQAMIDVINDADYMTPDEAREPRDRRPEAPAPPGPPSTSPCDRQADAMQAMACRDRAVAKDDAELNRVYRALMTRLSDPDDKAALRQAQRAWIAYRDAACELEGGEGSGRTYYASFCLSNETWARTEQLEGFLRAPVRR